MSLLRRVVTWKMCYPKYYCPTRWIGLATALHSYLNVQDLLLIYVDNLVDSGYLPYRKPEVEPAEGSTARVDNNPTSHDNVEEDRVHKDSFHVWGTNVWDLVVTKPVGDVDIVDMESRIAMETMGRANTFKDLPTATNKYKRSRLLCEKIGLTTMNYGISSIMCDILKPYKVFIERVQVQTHPVGHRIRQNVCTLFKILNRSFLSDSPSYGKHFHKWIARTDVTPTMADQVKAMGRQFVYHFLDNLRFRFRPYWMCIMAMETINPCAPHHLSPNAWIGVKDLVTRCMDDGISGDDVVEELKRQHEEAQDWCIAEVKACTSNLLRYYHDRLKSCKQNQEPSKYPLAERFARLIFSLHIASAIIETYFSKTKYIKNLHRSSMRDSLSTATLHVQQLRPYMDDGVVETIKELDIDKIDALSCVEKNLDVLRDKYVNKRLSKRFRDDKHPQKIVRPYRGQVTDVWFSKTDGHYLFHVTYDSDSDDEEQEQWEVSQHIDEYNSTVSV